MLDGTHAFLSRSNTGLIHNTANTRTKSAKKQSIRWVRNLQCDIRLHIRLDIRVLVYTFGGFWFGVAK